MNAKESLVLGPTENSAKPDISVWDVRELLDRLEGDHELFRELLQMFRADAETNLKLAANSLTRSDMENLTRAAHTLKGMLKNLSMNSSAEIAAALENAARENNAREAAAQLPLLEKALHELLPEVDAQLVEERV